MTTEDNIATVLNGGVNVVEYINEDIVITVNGQRVFRGKLDRGQDLKSLVHKWLGSNPGTQKNQYIYPQNYENSISSYQSLKQSNTQSPWVSEDSHGPGEKL